MMCVVCGLAGQASAVVMSTVGVIKMCFFGDLLMCFTVVVVLPEDGNNEFLYAVNKSIVIL